ncbi:MAG: hypothetical protein QW702_07885 [Candidatus Bathyarchaeia archaeon]
MLGACATGDESEEKKEEKELEEDKELLQLSELYQMLKKDAQVLARGLIDSVKFFMYLSVTLTIVGLASMAVSMFFMVTHGILPLYVLMLALSALVIIHSILIWRHYSNMIRRFSVAKLLA